MNLSSGMGKAVIRPPEPATVGVTACLYLDFPLPFPPRSIVTGSDAQPGDRWVRGGPVGGVADAAAERAARYLRSRSRRDRRAAGVVYTPSHLVEFVLDLAGYVDEKPLEALRLVDPACGAGAFLVAAMRRLARSVEKHGVDLHSARGSHVFADLVRQNLIGMDLDQRACTLARSSIIETFREITGFRNPTPLKPTIARGDFLQQRAFVGGLGTNRGSVNLVVGNPPYVTTTRLPAAAKKLFRERFETAHGRIDLYQLFFEKALRILPPGGRLAFITPDKFLTSRSGSRLREFLLRTASVLSVASFRSHRVFSDAAIVPCITVLEKTGEAAELRSLECSEKLDANARVTVVRTTSIPQRDLTSAPWQFGDIDLLALNRRLYELHGHLSNFVLRISAGVATGRDSTFIVSADGAADIEEELLRPVIRGRDIEAFALRPPDLLALVPYRYPKHGSPELIDIRRYPGAMQYLARDRSALERRHCVRVWRKQWYDLHDPIPFDIAKVEKIVVPDVANRNRFAVDRGHRLPTHSAYYLVPVDPRNLRFLEALLNSTALTFLMRFRSPVVKDGFSRYRRQFLADLAIPSVDRAAANAIARAGSEGDHDLLDALVFRALGVERHEARAMRRFLSHASSSVRGEPR